MPTGWVSTYVEARDYDDWIGLDDKEQTVRKAAHSRPANVPVEHGELEWIIGHGIQSLADRPDETTTQSCPTLLLPEPRFAEIGPGFGCPEDREAHSSASSART